MVSNSWKYEFKSQLIQHLFIIKQKKAPDMSSALEEIKKKIEQAKEGDPKVTELDLSEIKIEKFTPQINAVLQKCKNLQVLYLIDCGLTTLEGFPNLKLQAIDLSKNKIGDDGHLEIFLNMPELAQLIFIENNISRLETVLQLSKLSRLIEIDFEGNPVASNPKYSSSVFEKFPNMEYVDRKDKEGNEQPQEGEFEGGEDDDEEQQYEGDDDDEEEFDEDDEQFDEDEESEDKPKKGGRKKK